MNVYKNTKINNIPEIIRLETFIKSENAVSEINIKLEPIKMAAKIYPIT